MKKKLREIWQENKTARYTTVILFVLCLLLGSSMLGVSGSNGELVSKIKSLQDEKTSLNEQLSENKKNEEALRSRLTLCIQQKMSMARETSAYEDQQDEIERLSTEVSELRKKNSTLTLKNKTLKKQLEKSRKRASVQSDTDTDGR